MTPLFPNMSCAEGLAGDRYQKSQKRSHVPIWEKLAKPSLASCKAMKGAVCKRTAAS